MRTSAEHLHRIEKHIDKSGNCWNWSGAINNKGYGVLRLGRKTYLAHRITYAGANSVELTSEDVIRHSCDNSLCVNPAHLLAGTHADNHADMVSKGRHPHGCSHGMSKLNEHDVRAIRNMEGFLRVADIAKQFKVSKWTIYDVLNRRVWGHI